MAFALLVSYFEKLDLSLQKKSKYNLIGGQSKDRSVEEKNKKQTFAQNNTYD